MHQRAPTHDPADPAEGLEGVELAAVRAVVEAAVEAAAEGAREGSSAGEPVKEFRQQSAPFRYLQTVARD